MRTGVFAPLIAVVTLLFVVACGTTAPAATSASPSPSAAVKEVARSGELEAVIEGARKEGVLKTSLSYTLGQKGVQRLIDAFNKKYGLDIKIENSPNNKMTATAAQLMTELKSGGTPSWDLVTGTPRHFVEMSQQGLLVSYDWATLLPSIPKESVLLNGTYVAFAGEYYLPVYNPNLVKPQDVPRRWEDLLDPKWKGKIVAHNSSTAWVQLVQPWGEDRVTSLVEGLSKQEPTFVTLGQVPVRITSGEFPIGTNADAGDVFVAQAKGAPIRYAEEVKPVVAEHFGNVVPQRAQHPNAAKLFSAFQLTPEAQQIWWEEAKWAAPWLPGPLADWLKGKELSFVDSAFLQKEGSRLDDKYLKILGLK